MEAVPIIKGFIGGVVYVHFLKCSHSTMLLLTCIDQIVPAVKLVKCANKCLWSKDVGVHFQSPSPLRKASFNSGKFGVYLIQSIIHPAL